MRFYKQPHAFYAGIDLHARSIYTHILDAAGATVFKRDLPAKSKNDRIDAAKIAGLLRGGMFPMPTCRAGFELSRCVTDCRS